VGWDREILDGAASNGSISPAPVDE
jgi:hypothetical protein